MKKQKKMVTPTDRENRLENLILYLNIRSFRAPKMNKCSSGLLIKYCVFIYYTVFYFFGAFLFFYIRMFNIIIFLLCKAEIDNCRDM